MRRTWQAREARLQRQVHQEKNKQDGLKREIEKLKQQMLLDRNEKENIKNENGRLKEEVGRKNRLQDWLVAKGSNLDATALWKGSKIHGTDYHLVVAIALVEQGGYADTSIGFNFWGWNHPDGASHGDRMGANPTEAIYAYYQALAREGYAGLSAEGFKAKGYASSGSWLGNVNYFLGEQMRAGI